MVKEVRGIKIAFLGYTYGLSNEEELSEEEKARANIYSEELAKKDIEYAKENSLQKIHTVGRLDTDTEGLLLFTTNGDFSHSLANPLFHVKKTYYVELEKTESEAQRKILEEKFSEGFFIPEEKKEKEFISRPAILEWNSENSCRLTITEGKFHQVKRMFSAQRNKVVFLKRISIGSLALDEKLAPGNSRELSNEELSLLFK